MMEEARAASRGTLVDRLLVTEPEASRLLGISVSSFRRDILGKGHLKPVRLPGVGSGGTSTRWRRSSSSSPRRRPKPDPSWPAGKLRPRTIYDALATARAKIIDGLPRSVEEALAMWAPAVVGLPALAREAERQNRIAVIEPLGTAARMQRLVGAALAEAGWNDAAPTAATCIAEIPAQPVRWLRGWWVPLAMPSVCFGPPGQGKSHLGVDICARVSRGSAWPDGGRAPLGNALILSAEDDPATVLRPRLEAAGADLDRVFVLPAVGDFGGERRAFDMRRDAGVLEQTIAAHEAIVAVLDPLVSCSATPTRTARATCAWCLRSPPTWPRAPAPPCGVWPTRASQTAARRSVSSAAASPSVRRRVR